LSFARLAVTGVGVVSALGLDAEATFWRLCRGERGIGPISLFDPLDARSKVAGEVRGLDVRAVVPDGDANWSRTDAMALVAAREALGQAGRAGRLGVSVGGTTGGMLETEAGLVGGNLEHIEPERARRLLDHPLDRTATRLAAVFGAVRHSTLCAACASGAIAVARAAAWLEHGAADQVLAGGADGLCRLTFYGFDSLGALDPEPCRPFDRARRGLSLGEGAGFLVLEREATARARGAQILGFFAGTSLGAEAHHITHPEPSGTPSAELIRRALEVARLEPQAVGYVNAHGTGTPQNDAMEVKALHAAFGDHAVRVLVSSSKGQLGHTLGAAGAIEAVVTVLALARGVAPPTAGLEVPEDPTLRHVVGSAVAGRLDVALSCSFGFGGTGAVLVFEREDAPLREVRRAAARRTVVTGTAALHGSTGDPRMALDPERSRRFDRGTAFVTRGAEEALADARAARSDFGIVSGSAFGSVSRSVGFVLRALSRGVRRANPAEFPHLVTSAATGNASVYLGLRGPAVGVTAGAGGAEEALEVALSLHDFSRGGLVAGAAEEVDPIVAAVLGAFATVSGSVPRSEGGGFLVIEDERVALARKAPIRAVVHAPLRVAAKTPFPTSFGPTGPGRAVVITGLLSVEARAALRSSLWGSCPERSIVAGGAHEATGAVALAAAASAVSSGDVEEALACSGMDDVWLTRFTRWERPA
jgi:3-oxoacyl-[acyl-carrier-protein] synthase II